MKASRFALRSGSVTVEQALLQALSAAGHSVVLIGDDKAPLAARWAHNVGAVPEAGGAEAAADADACILVDDRIALRPARTATATGTGSTVPAAGAGDGAESLAAAARTVVWIVRPGDPRTADRRAQASRRGQKCLVIETGSVFGAAAPADDVTSALFALVRNLPVIPLLPAARRTLSPLFSADLARLVLAAWETGTTEGTLRALGDEVCTLESLLETVAELAERRPARLPLPQFLAGAGAAFAHLFGVELAAPDEGAPGAAPTTLPESTPDAFATLGITLTSLREALKRMATTLPEQRPTEGHGALQHKRFWVDIASARLDAEALLGVFRQRCAELIPIRFDVEQAEGGLVERGRTLTAALPLRGHIQMRVEEVAPRRIAFATVGGHPIAGVVRFLTAPLEAAGSVRFLVEVFARSGTPLDFLALHLGASVAQDATWKTLCERMLMESGGASSTGVEHRFETLSEPDARDIEKWVEALIAARERDEHEASFASQAGAR